MATVHTSAARPARGRELVLLVPALGLGAFAYAQVGLNTAGHIPADFYWHVLGLTLLALLIHVVLRRRAPYADPVILPITVALNDIKLAMIYRLDVAAELRG